MADNVLYYEDATPHQTGGMLKTSEAQRKAQRRYYDKKTKQFVFRLILGKDDDVIQRLMGVASKTDYLRELVRRDMRDNTDG